MIDKDRQARDREAFGARLRNIRIAAGLTQEQLAKGAELNRYTVSLYELGQRAPTADVLPRIARTLKARYEDLLEPLA